MGFDDTSRRKYLTLAGTAITAGLAGCGGDTEEADGGDTPGGDAENAAGASTDTSTEADTDAETETETATATEEPGEASVEILSRELQTTETEFGSTEAYAVFEIENSGEAPTGPMRAEVRYYDSDDNIVDTRTARLRTLAAGETWQGYIQYLGTDGETIDSVRVEAEFDSFPIGTPEEIAVSDESLSGGDSDEVTHSGTIANETGGELDYLQATSKFYASENVVIGTAFSNVDGIPEGESWSFENTFRRSSLHPPVTKATVLPSSVTF